MKPSPHPFAGNREHQSGLALFVSLIVLVALSIAGIALVRSIDTGSLIAGNLAFRQSANLSADTGIEAARTWLMNNMGTLTADNSANGYYAASQDALDLTGNLTPGVTADDVNWNGTGGVSQPFCLAQDAAGNTVCYIIHRLCNEEGALSSTSCSTQQTAMGGSSKGAVRPMTTGQEAAWTDVATLGVYRVTVRVAGPRNNVSFAQAFILI